MTSKSARLLLVAVALIGASGARGQQPDDHLSGVFAPVPEPVAAPVPTPSGIRITVPLVSPGDGYFSAALYDAKGVLVRSLLSAEPVKRGPVTVEWDGTTDLGKAAAPGTYSAQCLFFTSAPSLKYKMFVGKSGNPPYRTPDGKGDWGGNLGSGTSIVATTQGLILGCGCVEDNQITGIQQMDGDGNISLRYDSFYPWDSRMAAASQGQDYYLGILNAGKKQLEIADYTLGQPRGKILAALPTKPHTQTGDTRWAGRFTAWLDGLAATPDRLYATVSQDDSLFILDRATGNLLKQVTIPSPRGIVASGDHILLVSGDKVLRLTADGDVDSTLVDDGVLCGPGALAVDAAGDGFVANGPAGAQTSPAAAALARQVVMFSPQGKVIRKFGKTGGDADDGRFDSSGFGNISSLCIGPEAAGTGTALWVNDVATGFWRTSRWSLDGTLQRQWFGRRLALNADNINPARPNELIFTSTAFADEPGMTGYAIDLQKNTWAPAWHYSCDWADMYKQQDIFHSFPHGGNPIAGPKGDHRWPVFYYDASHFVTYQGRNYFINQSGNGDGAVFTYDGDHKPVPVALVGFHRITKLPDGTYDSSYDQGPNNWLTWADRNLDGVMSQDEITFTQNPPQLANSMRMDSAYLDDHLNIILTRHGSVDGKVISIDSELPLKTLLPNGVPVYDWADMKDLANRQAPDLTGGDGTKAITTYDMPAPIITPDGQYSLVSPASKAKLNLPGIDGQGWWASRNWRTKIAKWDANGQLIWAVGRRAPGKAERGQMYHPAALAGVAGGAVFITDTLGPMWVWDTSGLFIGHVFHDVGEDTPPDQFVYGETQSTHVFTDPVSGEIFSIANDQAAHIHQVILPERTPVKGPSVTLTAKQIADIAPWDPDGSGPTDKPSCVAEYAAAPPPLDGTVEGNNPWNTRTADNRGRQTMDVYLDGQPVGQVHAIYDDTNLYLGYDVHAPNGAANSGSELPYCPFVSGAYVDFTVGPDWNGPRQEVRTGDARVILARISGAGTLYQQGFWPIRHGGANPQTINSPAATTHFDQVTAVPGLKVAYKDLGTDAKTGFIHYSVTIAVPLASLGLTSPAGKTVGFDVSIGVANTAGNGRDRAAHWGPLSEGVVVDRPGSARLLPDTWGTLTFGAKPAAQN